MEFLILFLIGVVALILLVYKEIIWHIDRYIDRRTLERLEKEKEKKKQLKRKEWRRKKEEIRSKIDELTSQGLYKYLKNFVRRYSYPSYLKSYKRGGSDRDIENAVEQRQRYRALIENLQLLLIRKGFPFQIDEMILLIQEVDYRENFQPKIMYNNPQTVEGVVKNFLERFENIFIEFDDDKWERVLELKEEYSEEELFNQELSWGDSWWVMEIYLLDNLTRLLEENNQTAFDFSELIENIKVIKKKMDLVLLERKLASDEILVSSMEDIDAMSGSEFEKLLRMLFEKMGYAVEQTQLVGDQGADLIVAKFGEKTVVQAKRSKGRIGNKAVQEVVASIKHYNADKGMVVTNSYFTSSAIDLAESNNIELVDRENLIKLVEKYL